MILGLLACDDGPAPIVLISMDTLRADRVGVLGNPRGLTPSIDRLAADSVVFTNAYAQATTTAPSHASLFTSRYASEEDAEDRRPAFTGMPTLAEVLGTYGWKTAAFVAGGDLSPELGVGRGFQLWNSVKDFGSLFHTAPPALSWLDTHGDDGPFLLFVHGYDAHSPYLKPAPFGYAYADMSWKGPGQDAVHTSTERVIDGWMHPDLGSFLAVMDDEPRPRSAAARAHLAADARSPGRTPPQKLDATDIQVIRDVYDGGVAYADLQLGLLLTGLAERGWMDRATIVLFSDHGEQLGEDGIFNHCCGVGDEESHVLLLVRPPGGVQGGRRVEGLVELVDVMPTVLELAGATPPAGIRGQSFAAALRGEPFAGRDVAWTQGGAAMRSLGGRAPGGRLVYSGVPSSSPFAATMVASAALPGPSFTSDLPATEQEKVRAAMVAWLPTLTPPQNAAAAPLSDALKASLRAHGYWDVGQ